MLNHLTAARKHAVAVHLALTNMSKSSSSIIAVTVMWLLTIPGTLYFSTKVLQFPWDLTLLLLVPVFIIWVPASYSLIAATNRKYDSRELPELPSAARLRLGLLGVLTVLLKGV